MKFLCLECGLEGTLVPGDHSCTDEECKSNEIVVAENHEGLIFEVTEFVGGFCCVIADTDY